jgi:GAF domain-containing protein
MEDRKDGGRFAGSPSAMYKAAQEAIQQARHARELVTPVLQRLAREDPEFLDRYRQALFDSVLNAAIEAAGADMANLQLIDPVSATLRIAAQRGFSRPFLEFFDSVPRARAACGLAFRKRNPVLVEDVADSAIVLGTPALEVVLDAGVRAVQSAPLIGRSGATLGVISTHWHAPRRLGEREARLLERLARNAARWIEDRMALAPVRPRAAADPDGSSAGRP